jgi:hypothetical protein
MTGFLGEIGKKLADRWVALLAIPGLLYLGAVIVAAVLGQAHGLSYPDLSRKIAAWAASPTLKSAGGTVLIIAAVLAGSVLIGLTAAAGGRFIEMLWTLPGKRVPAEWLASWRRGRSRKAKAIADDPDSTSAQVRKAIARADRICLIEADRPTWIGDRLRACHVRIERAYGLDLNAAWPRLWLTVPDTFRTELGAARDAFSGAALLTAWAVLYLALGIWWWPAIPIALITGATAIIRAHLATNNLADLIESAADLQGRDLATQLDENLTGPMTPAIGKLVTTRMRKSRWDPSSPLEDLNSRQAEAASRIHPEDATKPVPATAPADLSLSLLQRSSRQAMSAVGHHLSTGRDQASGTRFRVRFWPRTTVAGQMIVAGFAVIVGAASGTATALAGLGTAIAGEVAAGVLVAGVVAGVATLQLSATDAAPRRSEVRTRKSDSPSGEAWETAVSKDLADDGDDGSSNGNDNGDEAGGERQAWPGLSCPDTVVAGTAFDLYVGLAGDRDTSVYGTGRLQVPAEEFELGIEIQANGFAMLRGVRKFTLHVTPEDPFPIRALRLEPTEDPGFRERRIEALFTVGGELRGYAARDVTVVATRDEAAAAGERSHDHSADVPARQPNVLGGGREVADMTIMIIKDAKQPTTLNWSASSPYFDILLSTSEPPHSDMGDPAAFLGEVVRKASEAFSV